MKRFTRYVSLILALVTVFMVPVSADDFDNLAWINLMDYGTILDSGNIFDLDGTSGRKYIYVNLPYDMTPQYCDFVIRTDATINNIVTYYSSLTVLSLGNKLYRVYGDFDNRLIDDPFIGISVQAGGSYIEFLSFWVSNCISSHYAEVGTLTVGSSSYTMSSSTSSVTYNFPTDGTSGNGQSFRAFFSSSNWKKYDYLDFYIRAWIGSLDSISCSFAGVSVPCSISYISSDDWDWPDYYNVLVRVDLRGLDRTKTDVPLLLLSGVYEIGAGQFVELIQVNGYVVSDSVDPYSLWFSRLFESQKAYYDDVALWNQSHEQFLLDRFAVINQTLSGISSAIVSMSNTLKVSIDTAGINIVDKLTSVQNGIVSKLNTFQSSMENYLDQLPARIAEEIAKIFKPTEGKFESAKEESQELAEEKLGAVYQSAVVIDQIAGAFTVQTPQTSIVVPLVSVEVLPGVPFQFGGWDVPIVPVGLEFLVDILKYVIDIVCTLAFLNGMKRRLDGFFGGESGVD